jgi:hypothetical protein
MDVMKRLAIAGLCLALLAGAAGLRAQERPGTSTPGAELAWLEQLAGEWETEGEAFVDPSQPPLRSQGTESIRKLGDSWIVSEIESSFMGTPFSAVFTLGYDAARGKLVGTWVDSGSGRLWHYEGTLDAGGKTATLAKGGPCLASSGGAASQQDRIEIESASEKTLTSQGLVDGQWVTMLTVRSRRKP